MSDLNIDLSRINADEAADLPRATYFVLESHDDCFLAPLEEANEYSIHIGLPDRPDRRHAWKFDTLVEALVALSELKKTHPNAGMWLSCEEILEEILGSDVFRGAVIARASLDPSDFWDAWRQFAADIAWAEAKGRPVVVDQYAGPVIHALAKHL